MDIIKGEVISYSPGFQVGYIFGQLDTITIAWKEHGKDKHLAEAFLRCMDELGRLDCELYYRVKIGFLDMIEEMREVIKE